MLYMSKVKFRYFQTKNSFELTKTKVTLKLKIKS